MREEWSISPSAFLLQGKNVEPVPPNGSASVPFSETIKEEEGNQEK